MSYNAANYKPDADTQVIGGILQILTGGKIVPNSGTQAATIAAISETAGEMAASERIAFNAVLTALKNLGILAAS